MRKQIGYEVGYEKELRQLMTPGRFTPCGQVLKEPPVVRGGERPGRSLGTQVTGRSRKSVRLRIRQCIGPALCSCRLALSKASLKAT